MVAIDPHEHRRAERPRDEGEREQAERIERARHRIDEREQQRREDQHRCDRIDEEIEELAGAADDDADGDLARRDAMVACGYPLGIALQ
jgi:hypothetical protein